MPCFCRAWPKRACHAFVYIKKALRLISKDSWYSVSLLLGRLVGFLVVFLCLISLRYCFASWECFRVGAVIACGCLPCSGQWSIGVVDTYIDGLVFFRGVMVYQDCGVEKISAIEVVVYVVLDREGSRCGGGWICTFAADRSK